MSLSRLRASLAILVASASVAALGCSAIFNPENSDDVLRCDNVDDCQKDDTFAAALADKRVKPACVAPGSDDVDFTMSDENTVCSTTDNQTSCNPNDAGSESEFAKRYAEVTSVPGVYLPCQVENLGKQGCKPDTGSCAAGLTVNAYGICDDPNSELPAYEPSAENRGQDVLDQYCRHFYCDEGNEFTCVRGDSSDPSITTGRICKRCDPDKAVGEGGCATMWVNGTPSSVYASTDGCDETKSSFDTATFGPVPSAPPAP